MHHVSTYKFAFTSTMGNVQCGPFLNHKLSFGGIAYSTSLLLVRRDIKERFDKVNNQEYSQSAGK